MKTKTLFRMSVKTIAALALLTLPLSSAMAQSSAHVGTIRAVALAGGTNYAFRVNLSANGQDPLSDCTYNFAFLNVSHDNYPAIVATLLTSYAQNKPVTLVVSKDANGFCAIDYIEA